MINIISLQTINNYIYINFTGTKEEFNTYINKIISIPNIEWCKDKDGWRAPKSSFLRIQKAFSHTSLSNSPPPKIDINLKDIGKLLKLSPYEYQKEAIKFAVDNKESLLILPCGSGDKVRIAV